jgi:hypothetical protein
MQIVKANCPSCGGSLSIPDDRDAIYCSSCGSSLAIERGEGFVTLKFAEKIVSAIEQAGNATQDAIRESSYVTRTEFQRLHANQELSTLQLQLSNLQTEMRTVERSPSSLATIAQKLKLHQAEYELLDRMYAVHQRISTPDPANLQACIDFANWEISWLRSEIAALSFSGRRDRVQLIKSLNTNIIELTSKIAGLKISQLRNRFSSYKQPDPTPSDFTGIAALLALLVVDEQNARAFRSSSEGKAVHDEIFVRTMKLKSWLVEGDRKRIGEMLASPNFRANPDNVNSLHELLVLINRDLQNDFRIYEPGVAHQYQKALLDRKSQTEKQIKKLEFRLQNGRNPGLFPALFAAIAAGFAALFGGGASHPTQPNASSPSMPLKSIPVQIDPPDQVVSTGRVESEAVQSKLEPAWGLPSMPGNQPLKSSDFLSTGLGCLSGLAITVVIAFIGLFVFGLVNGARPATGRTVSIVFLFTSIGFVLSALVFLRITAPRISIKGFGPLPSISINPKQTGKGIQNSGVIKLYIAVIICIFVYLVYITLITLISDFSIGLSILIFLIGLVLGPVLAGLAANRASIS